MAALKLTLVLALCFHLALSVPPSVGPYPIKFQKIHLGGLRTSLGLIQTALLYYPDTDEAGPFPLVSFAHGMFNGGPFLSMNYSVTFESLASFGYIVVAPMSCVILWCEFFPYDLLQGIKGPFNNPDMHPIFARADFTATGIFGHSMGGDAVTRLATWKEDVVTYNIKAAVGLFPGIAADPLTYPSTIHVPYFFVTGTGDNIVSDTGIYKYYSEDPTNPKVYADFEGAEHNDPTNLSHMHSLGYMIQFFECHLRGEKQGCAYIYSNNTGALCNSDFYKLNRCEFTGAPQF